jgi:hypothetical protein
MDQEELEKVITTLSDMFPELDFGPESNMRWMVRLMCEVYEILESKKK